MRLTAAGERVNPALLQLCSGFPSKDSGDVGLEIRDCGELRVQMYYLFLRPILSLGSVTGKVIYQDIKLQRDR